MANKRVRQPGAPEIRLRFASKLQREEIARAARLAGKSLNGYISEASWLAARRDLQMRLPLDSREGKTA